MVARFSFLQAVTKNFKLSLPIAGSRLVILLTNFTVMIFIAHLGHDQLAAGALISSVYLSVVISLIAILFSTSVLIGHHFGANEWQTIGSVVRQALFLAFLVGIPASILLWNFALILEWLHQPPVLIVLVKPYFRVLALGAFPALTAAVFRLFAASVGCERLLMYWGVLFAVLQIIPGYCLMYGLFGLPRLGMLGIAVAWTMTYWILFILGLITIKLHPKLSQANVFPWRWRGEWSYMRQLFQIGWPISLQFSGELFALFLGSVFVGWLGTVALGAWQVVMQISLVMIIAPYGMAQANTILVGQALGSGNHHQVRVLGLAGIFISFVFMLIVAIIYITLPDFLANFYLDKTSASYMETLALVRTILLVTAFGQMFDALRTMATGTLRGMRDTRVPMLSSILVNWLLCIPLAYAFAFYYRLGPVGVSIGFLIGEALNAMYLFRRFWVKSR